MSPRDAPGWLKWTCATPTCASPCSRSACTRLSDAAKSGRVIAACSSGSPARSARMITPSRAERMKQVSLPRWRASRAPVVSVFTTSVMQRMESPSVVMSSPFSVDFSVVHLPQKAVHDAKRGRHRPVLIPLIAMPEAEVLPALAIVDEVVRADFRDRPETWRLVGMLAVVAPDHAPTKDRRDDPVVIPGEWLRVAKGAGLDGAAVHALECDLLSLFAQT